MVQYPPDKQTAGCSSPHHWLMSLAMYLAALCDMCGVFGVDVAFACHFVASQSSPLSTPIMMLVVLVMSVKVYLKWQANQLAIHSIVGA